MRQGRRAQAAFTLLELLVAIAIFALVSGVAYGGLLQILKVRDRVQAEQQFWRSSTAALALIHDDLAEARPRPGRDGDGNTLPALYGGDIPSAIKLPDLELTRGGRPLIGNEPRGDLERVAYRLEGGVLYRATWNSLDRAPDGKPMESPLLKGVEAFSLRFYDGGQWVNRWPVPDENGRFSADVLATLPKGIELKLRFKDGPELVRTLLVAQ